MLRLAGATYRYPTGRAPALGPVDLEVLPGEVVLLTGPTGCGKSTLLRLAAGLLQRHGQGETTGLIEVDGLSPAVLAPAARAARVGFVSQEPSDQIVSGTQGDEIAFGLESVGAPPERVHALVLDALAAFGLPPEPWRSPRALSGGQRQRLVVAAALAAGGRLLLLDEPLSQLDPAGALGLLARLREAADRGVAVLLVEHRLEATLPWVDRVIVLEGGRLVGEFVADRPDVLLLRRLGLSVPGLVDLEARLVERGLDLDTLQTGVEAASASGASGSVARPTAVGGRGPRAPDRGFAPTSRPAALSGRPQDLTALGRPSESSVARGPLPPSAIGRDPTLRPGRTPVPVHRVGGEVLVEVGGLGVRYGAIVALEGVSLRVEAGERVALLGANGSGKSTLLGAMCGRVKGAGVTRRGRVLEVPQEADLTLFCETVRDELAYGPVEARLGREAVERRVGEVAEGLSVAELLERAPQALSRGQRLRVAVGAALTVDAAVLLLDEPTAGQDRDQVERMMAALSRALGPERALVFATHDVELALRHATRWVVLHEGRVVADGPPEEALERLPPEITLPPLAAWLRARGLPVASVDEVLGWL